jgi:hypothetical protein
LPFTGGLRLRPPALADALGERPASLSTTGTGWPTADVGINATGPLPAAPATPLEDSRISLGRHSTTGGLHLTEVAEAGLAVSLTALALSSAQLCLPAVVAQEVLHAL